MANDTIELLDYLGWTEPRSVHVVGISMGGMIAQHIVSHRLRPQSEDEIVPMLTVSPNRWRHRVFKPPNASPRSPSRQPNPETSTGILPR
jgi:pimeloyl-ACP methyl ester carboxylesterase